MWIKLSGASKDLINRTGIFKQHESIKYSRYGRLILVPPILGAIGSYYAFSIIEKNQYICAVFAAIWFFIILAVDMAMSATMYKSDRKKSTGFAIAIFFRLVLSVCVGLVVSHPLILRIFEPSIEKNINDKDQDDKNQKVLSATSTLASAKTIYQIQIDKLNSTNKCLTNLTQFERSTANTTSRDFFETNGALCGSSSGMGAGCGTECHNKEDIIEANDKKIAAIRTEMNTVVTPETSILDTAIIQGKTVPATTDYLARTEALDILMNGDGQKLKEHTHVSRAATLLIFFLVVLDCLIVIFKWTTPIGAYEYAIDALEEEYIKQLQAESIIHISTIEQIATLKGKLEIDAFDILLIQNLLTEVIRQIDISREDFNMRKKQWLRGVGLFEFSRRKQLKRDIFKIERMYDNVRAKTLENVSSKIHKM